MGRGCAVGARVRRLPGHRRRHVLPARPGRRDLAARARRARAGAAAVAGADPAAPATWRPRALVLAFGSPRRGLGLLAAFVLAPVLGLPLVLGPLLFGPSLPVLCGLALLERTDDRR